MVHSLPTPASKFLEGIRPWQRAYVHSTFTYIAVNSEGKYVLLRGCITLRAFAPETRRSRIHSKMFSADEIDLAVTQPDALEALLVAVTSGGQFSIGNDIVLLQQETTIQARHERAVDARPSEIGYVHRLTLYGMSRWSLLSSLDIALEQDLASHGFRSVDELLDEYGLNLRRDGYTRVEVIAEPVACIDRKSKLSLRVAHVQTRVARAIAPSSVSLILFGSPSGDGNKRARMHASAEQIAWEQDSDCWIGRWTIELPYNVVSSCRAVVNSTLHDELPIVDEIASPNLCRVLVEFADPQLKRFRDPLINPLKDEGRREFEAGIATLLFMLGFNSVRVGASKKLSDAADIFAMTPLGEILVVESTTEVPDPHKKLQKLLRRVEEARAVLCKIWPGLKGNQVTGLILVPRPQVELAELMRVERQHGVILLGREDIERAVEETQFAPGPDAMLARWRRQPLIDLLTQGLDA